MTSQSFDEGLAVVIDAGIVSASTDARLVGQHRYFISIEEVDGGRIVLWDGADRNEAVREVQSAIRDFDCRRLIDRTGGLSS